MKSFASDNYAGVHPALMEALMRANSGHARAYGADEWTQRCLPLFEQAFGKLAGLHFVFNGTGANVLSLAACTRSFEAVLCADISHIYSDEGSAPENFTGCRMFPVLSDEQGKLQPAALEERLARKGDPHYAQPRVLSLTQATEYGTVYTPEELRYLAERAHSKGLWLHMDGARFFNAAASLHCSPSALSSDCGVDILSLGGAKLGMMYGEAVLVFHPELEKNLRFQHKQVMQLASKTRFIAAQFEALLQDELWRSLAQHAHSMAQRLAERLSEIPEVERSQPVQANAVFARIPKAWNAPLMEAFPFYIWDESSNEARLMCAWDTQPEDIEAFVTQMKALSKEL
ncbi:MAG: low specificity L-threonine aldolase [Bacteroidetes bacterium]|nr:low specificity L-threonine aldolase [Bacteroidota bacterium]